MLFNGFRVANILGFVLLASMWSASAQAASGTIYGKFSLYNHNGNWCPTNANCTGTIYPASVHDTWEPVRNAKVEVHNDPNGSNALVGTGYTNDNGDFNISWNIPSGVVGPLKVWVIADQRDGRFKIRSTNGAQMVSATSSSWSVSHGSNTNIGSQTIGSSGSPPQHWNAYWAAERLWRETYSYVGVLSSNFTNVEVRGFANTISGYLGTCNTSCADGAGKRVQMDANSAFSPQGRMMHELGHIANYVTKPYKNAGDYCYPSTGSCSWNQGTAEWGAAGFEEAFATLGGTATFWWADAELPTVCTSSGACYNSGGTPNNNSNVEATSFPYGTDNCVANEGRWPLSHMRFHWDVYDAHDDGAGDTMQEGFDCFWCVFANLSSYDSGTGSNDINEPWNSALTSIDNYDGRGSASWRWNYINHYNSFDWLWENNCSSP